MGCIMLTGVGNAMSQSNPKLMTIIVLLGPPGAGKGTHAGPLSEHISLPHISTGDLFRENIRNNTVLGQKVKSFMDQGKLVPDELVLDMLFQRMENPDCVRGCILDGFPRTVSQAKALDAKLGKKSRIIALNFNVPDAVLIERISGRLICKECKKPYHKRFDPPRQANVCDACGGALYSRDDDQENIVRKRLEVYHEESQPLIDYYAKRKGELREIDSQNSKEQVFRDVMIALSSKD
ncbi:MAG: adk-A [Parachlamydiales bacterium]|nr:adk-A [Parachlamydiales bacterium]